MTDLKIPAATYRLQFHSGFGFRDAGALLSYLHALGITDVYASPIFQARKGSLHGYDIVDAGRLNPELGTEEDFNDVVNGVKQHGMAWIQDIVPNHMAYDGQNAMLMDVIENGANSEYYAFFDIEWNHPYESIRGKVLAPFLGQFYSQCLEKGEIRLEYGQAGLGVHYYSLRLPLRIESYNTVFSGGVGSIRRKLGSSHPDIIKLLGVFYILKSLASVEDPRERSDQVRFVKSMLWELYTANDEIRQWMDQAVSVFNGQAGRPETFSALDQLLSEQLFRLSFWKVAAEEINYRRFFNINELISLRVEDERVFERTHHLIFKLIEEDRIHGLRVDHIDGLYDPAAYLSRIRQKAGNLYVAVEKILGHQEEMPENWPVQGNTGYDFLNHLNGIFCERRNERRFDQIYTRFVGPQKGYPDLVSEKKRLIIGKYMAGDVDFLAHLLKSISSRDRHGSDITLYGLRRALVEVLTFFPVYRSYVSQETYNEVDRQRIQEAVRKAEDANPGLLHELNFIERFLLLDFGAHTPEEEKNQWTHFVMRFQQFAGPLIAKGFEDTTLYVYNRLLSLNEVGGDPGQFGFQVKQFHAFNDQRASRYPHTMNATSTHDTKRGEDARARINVISEMPDEWEDAVKCWSRINRSAKPLAKGRQVPDPNDEYFLYQTLVGGFPLQESQWTDFRERLKAYMIKAVREAKVHTEWLKPDQAYEEGFSAFIDQILSPSESNQFLKEFFPIAGNIAYHGMLNSLSQTLIKIFSPGVPDFYQGTELWDLSFVDPDNRRAVDFNRRKKLFDELKQREAKDPIALVKDLLLHWQDGRVKLYLIYKALNFRRMQNLLVQEGRYIPLYASGKFRRNICAFARSRSEAWAVVAAPRLTTKLVNTVGLSVGKETWEDHTLALPREAPDLWFNVLTGEELETSHSERTKVLSLGAVFQEFPLALLTAGAPTGT